MAVFILSVLVVAAAMLLMSVGIILRGKSFKASCGSHGGGVGPDGQFHDCTHCDCDQE